MNTPRLLLDLQDVDALMVYVRECRRHNDDAAIRALGLQLIDMGSSVELTPGDPIKWLKGEQSRHLQVSSIEISFLWDHRRAVSLACDVSELVLPLFESEYPGDARPRVAIKTARAWSRGEVGVDECFRAADAAADAASTAYAAAYAAAFAAFATFAAFTAADAASFAASAAYAADADAASASAYAASTAASAYAASNAASASAYAASAYAASASAYAASNAADAAAPSGASARAQFLQEHVIPLIAQYALTEEV